MAALKVARWWQRRVHRLMDTELLRTFIEVSKTRHFGRAAENLYLTQSAVSFRIRQLEQQLGVSLFARHRNNIRLTASGERLLPYADAILHTLGRAKQDVALPVSASSSPSAPRGVLGARLQRLAQPCLCPGPGLAVRLETASREHLCRQLLERSSISPCSPSRPRSTRLPCTLSASWCSSW